MIPTKPVRELGPIERAIREAAESGDRACVTRALAAMAGVDIGHVPPDPMPPDELAALRARLAEPKR